MAVPSSNERTIFVSTEDVQSTPATCSDAMMAHDGSTATGWKSPKQQSTQTWAPTLKQTHLKNTLWYTMWYIAMASILECWGINDEMVGGFWVLNIYFIRKGSLLQGIPTNHLAPKHQLSRAQKLVNSFMQGVTRGFSCPRTTRDPGSRDLPPCEFQQQTSSNNLTKWNNKGHATLTINSCCTYLGVLKEFLRDELAIIHVFVCCNI